MKFDSEITWVQISEFANFPTSTFCPSFEFISQGPSRLEYKTYDSKGNRVMVRYNYEHLHRVMAARDNVGRYCNG